MKIEINLTRFILYLDSNMLKYIQRLSLSTELLYILRMLYINKNQNNTKQHQNTLSKA